MAHDEAKWQAENNHYLAAALNWLRLKLTLLAEPGLPPYTAPQTLQAGLLDGLRRPKAVPAGAQPVESVSNDEVARAYEAMKVAESLDPLPALLDISSIFGLSSFEQHVLLLCAGMELDTRIAALCAQAQGERAYPSFALGLALFEDASWDALSPERPLRYWRLIEINQPAMQPLTTSALRIDERILNAIKGLNYIDDRLSTLLLPLPPVLFDLPDSQQSQMVTFVLDELSQASRLGRAPLVHLLGADSITKQVIAEQVGQRLGLRVLRLSVELLPSQSAEMETLARLWARERALLPVALYMDAQEREQAGDVHAPMLGHFLQRNRGLLFLDTRDMLPDITPNAITVDVVKPARSEQRTAWQAMLGRLGAGNLPAQLSAQFDLNLTTIAQIARLIEGRDNAPEAQAERLWKACLSSSRPRMEALAQRIDVKATWDDIVLPEHELRLLHHVSEQVRQRSRVYEDWGFRRRMNRGLGISVLCAGESGTGKTMAAEVLANELRLDLYRIDLSAVVSKYIGETEKNLRRLFDAAEDGGAVLFFDEADALFGKRSEVKDSHDRYANIEINYLLQRIESYRGLALLATNLKSTLDSAFLRRLRFIVTFPLPGVAERRLIWRKVFPLQTPVEGLDYERLAKFNLSGGNIHSIALNAAFLAASLNSPVRMPFVLEALRIEYIKLERPISESEFYWPASDGVRVL